MQAVRQVGQGAPVQQGQGAPGIALVPQPRRGPGQVGGQGLGADVQPEHALRGPHRGGAAQGRAQGLPVGPQEAQEQGHEGRGDEPPEQAGQAVGQDGEPGGGLADRLRCGLMTQVQVPDRAAGAELRGLHYLLQGCFWRCQQLGAT